MKTVKVKQTEDAVPVEVLAQSIVDISQGVKRLLNGPLNEKALILLIQHAAPTSSRGKMYYSKISGSQIKAVLEGITSLEKEYLKPKK